MTSRLFVGSRKGLFAWSRGPSGWNLDTVHFTGEQVTMLLPEAKQGDLYAGLMLGHFGAKLHRLGKGAAQWEECAVPVFPAGAEVNDGPPAGDGAVKRKPASLSEIWALEASPADPNTLWAGTIPGGLFRSPDRGKTWELIEPLWNAPERWRWFGGGKDDPGIHSIAIDPRRPDSITVGISCGGVWRSFDGGATWSGRATGLRAAYMPPNLADDPVTQDPHRLAWCGADPDTVWMQHHNGVFLSRDGGTAWQELTTPRPSNFGFAVAAHPRDRQTAWLVPASSDQFRTPVDARVVVSRTRDGGASFEVLGRGLPDHMAYDIVYRHALDVDGDGQTLAMGSTTGGLWVSENAGDDWTCLSHTLPPIYCVRFGAAA